MSGMEFDLKLGSSRTTPSQITNTRVSFSFPLVRGATPCRCLAGIAAAATVENIPPLALENHPSSTCPARSQGPIPSNAKGSLSYWSVQRLSSRCYYVGISFRSKVDVADICT
jgi:hypothetical protein